MNEKFLVQSLYFTEVTTLPNAWKPQDYLELLTMMEFDNLSEIKADEIEEMCLLALTDLKPIEAAELVLIYLLGNKLGQNQIHELAQEMLDDKMWEEYPDIHLHREIFKVNELLYRAFNGKFPKPEILKISFTLKCNTKIKAELVERDFVRILECGTSEDTVIGRLFHEELSKGDFFDAKGIIWQYERETKAEDTLEMVIYSSLYWYNEFRYNYDFDATIPVGNEVRV